MELFNDPAFMRAVDTARYFIIMVEPRTTKPEYWQDYIVARDSVGIFHVYEASAWTPQYESILPWWRRPNCEPVARVSQLDGSVTLIEGAA